MSRANFQIEVLAAEYDGLVNNAVGFLTELGYEEIEPEAEGTRLFKKGRGVLTAPLYVEISAEDRGAAKLVNFDGFVVVYLFITQGKIAEQSFTPEFTLGVIPRRMGYKDFTALRAHLTGEEPEERVSESAGRPANKLLVALAVIIPAFIVLVICLCILLCFSSSIINVISTRAGM